MRTWLLLLPLMLGACGTGATPDPELAGDHAYAAGRFAEAASDYALSAGRSGGGRVLTKEAQAALRAGELGHAAAAYARVAVDDPTRIDDAADGLEQVAHAADAAGDGAALRTAVLALRHLAPGRPVLRYALAVAEQGDIPAADAVVLLPPALAAADAPATIDSLLVRYGHALEQTAACEEASQAFHAVLRRSADSALQREARTGFDECSLRLGIAELAAGRPADAVRWFHTVSAMDSTSWTGRRALLGLGDASRAEGDTASAIAAFQHTIASGDAKDSLSVLAAARLESLGASLSAVDSSHTGIP